MKKNLVSFICIFFLFETINAQDTCKIIEIEFNGRSNKGAFCESKLSIPKKIKIGDFYQVKIKNINQNLFLININNTDTILSTKSKTPTFEDLNLSLPKLEDKSSEMSMLEQVAPMRKDSLSEILSNNDVAIIDFNTSVSKIVDDIDQLKIKINNVRLQALLITGGQDAGPWGSNFESYVLDLQRASYDLKEVNIKVAECFKKYLQDTKAYQRFISDNEYYKKADEAVKKAAREAASVVSQREQPESTAAKADNAIATVATAVGLPRVGEVVSGALGIDAASRREAALAAEGEKARKHYETETSKPEYTAKQTEDPRMLAQLVSQGKISQEEAEKKLEQHLKLRGGHDDITQHMEKRLKDLRATPPAPVAEPYKKNQNTLVKSAFEDIYSDLKRGWNWLTGNKTEMKESYYHRLANLFEETSDQPMDGINLAAYGYTPRGQRNARKAIKQLANSSSGGAGDSTTEAPDLEPESTERPHIDTVVAPHIETLISAAAQHEIDLGHGEAFDPRSRDHQRLIIKTKDPEVMKASEAIRQIRKDYGMED